MDYVYTRHQTARGALPDAEQFGTMYLLKSVSKLGLTYQIKVLTFKAISKGNKLVIRVPASALLTPSLQEFQNSFSKSLKIERL
jgi:hypothetical protein